jgi:hypothetical protein
LIIAVIVRGGPGSWNAYRWSIDTVQALRDGDFSRIDMDELINEIGSIASGLRRELVSILTDIMEALLLPAYVKPGSEEAGRQLVHAQAQLQLLLYASPSLKEARNDAIAKAYKRAKDSVAEDDGVAKLPDDCPFPVDRIPQDPYDRLVAEGKLA